MGTDYNFQVETNTHPRMYCMYTHTYACTHPCTLLQLTQTNCKS